RPGGRRGAHRRGAPGAGCRAARHVSPPPLGGGVGGGEIDGCNPLSLPLPLSGERNMNERQPMTWTINCDMGEAYGLYTMGDDAGIMPFITVANVACGFHAADPMVMRQTVQLAKRFGVKVGAHP